MPFFEISVQECRFWHERAQIAGIFPNQPASSGPDARWQRVHHHWLARNYFLLGGELDAHINRLKDFGSHQPVVVFRLWAVQSHGRSWRRFKCWPRLNAIANYFSTFRSRCSKTRLPSHRKKLWLFCTRNSMLWSIIWSSANGFQVNFWQWQTSPF